MSLQQRLDQAIRLHQAGAFADAINCYRDILVEDPNNIDAVHLLGVALEQAGHPAQGKPLVEFAVRREPGIAAYRISLGNIHQALEDYEAAEAAFSAALKIDPGSTDALNNLGLLAQRREAWGDASQHFRAALAVSPDFLPARFNLAATDWLAGRPSAAIPVFADILPRTPEFAGQVTALGKRALGAKDFASVERLLAAVGDRLAAADRDMLAAGVAALQGDAARAEELYRKSLDSAPDNTAALRNLGQLLMDQESFAAAVPVLERALALQPEELPVLTALGVALSRTDQHERAIPLLQRSVERSPDVAGVWGDLAKSYADLQRLDEACDALGRVIALDPDRALNYAAMGGLEARRGNLSAGEWYCNEALRRDPAIEVAYGNLAHIRGIQRRFDEMLDFFHKQLELRPDHGTHHSNLSFTLLRLGRYEEGWKHFHWRWKSGTWTTPEKGARGLPRWNGEIPAPGRILVWREQGIGDEILYASLLPELAARGLDIVLACNYRLVPLFARSLPGIEVVADEDDLHVGSLKLACQCPIGNLAPLCRPDASSFEKHPATYLKADPDRAARIRERYRALGGKRLVGISWSSRNRNTGRHKSIALPEMLPLLREPDTTFVSLQYGDTAEDMAFLSGEDGAAIYRDPEIDPLRDVEGQAAQIAALDMVVTVSTAAAHLAAALGKPTLILLPEDWGQLWYWGHQDRTPWYPQVRLCRGDTGERAHDIVLRAIPMFRNMLAGRERS